MSRITLLDIIKRNGSDPAVGLIDEASSYNPEMNLISGRTIKGVGYDTRVRVELPTVGFRDANDGVDATKGRYENRRVECHILNPRWECDKAVADSSEDGAEAVIAEEATGIVAAAWATVCKQVYYGRGAGGDAKGFPGLAASVLASMSVKVAAAGATAGTGSSVWALKFGTQGVQWVMGNDGQLKMDDPRIETITGANGKPLTGYVQEMLARIGLQVGNLRGVGRIYNLTADAGHTLTDARLAELLALFAVGYVPDVLLMSKRSQEQLRASRTATNATGAPAPIPQDAFGIPIVATESIMNTEAIEA